MALHQKRQFQKPGLPELVAILLTGVTVVAATLWWQDTLRPPQKTTEGRVLQSDIRLTHYNAADVRPVVRVTYQYSVGGQDHVGSWAGQWPESRSPNALPPDRLDVLREKDHALVVYYDPGNPSVSFLHEKNNLLPRVHLWLFIAALSIAVLYYGICYPRWRQSRLNV